jgi:chemotaxis protein CheY-P-specific phosphatase CheC
MIELSNLIITTLMSGIGELLGSQFSRAHPAIVRLSDKVQLVSPELINKQILNVQLTYTIPDHKIKCKMIILISENSIKSLQKRLSYI